jgi:hypothetical protein
MGQTNTKETQKVNLTLKQLQESSYKCSDKVVTDLKAAFQNDFTDEEACRYARIGKDSYYRWRNESDEFCEEMDIAKDFIFSTAKELLRKKVKEGDIDAAKWLLERRKKKLYSSRTELTGEEGKSINIVIKDVTKDEDKK